MLSALTKGENMKRKFIEVIAEIALTLFALFLGMVVASNLGVDLEAPDVNYELMLLLGLIIIIVVCGIVYLLMSLLFGKRRK